MLPEMSPEIEAQIKALWNIMPAKTGALTAVENAGGVRLHSAYSPEREAAGAVAASGLSDKETAVFYGFGLGYHVIECARNFSSKKLVLIEPDILHFYAALSALDWSNVFKVENLVIAVGCPEDQILHLIENTKEVGLGEGGIAGSVFFDIAPFTAHAAQYFENVRTIIKRNKTKNEINAATLKKFGHLWCRNSLANLPRLAECAGLPQGSLSATLPFLICGAGPSLQKILPQLAELSKRAVIVCVETALHALQRAGIQPDFILLTDPQFWAYRHIAGLSALQSVLITEVSAYPAVFRFPCRRILLCKSQFPVGAWFEQQLLPSSRSLGDLGTGGSVASSAWNFAHLCSAREIYTAGLDFSFPNNQTHIKGSSAEQTWHTVSTRLAGAEKFVAQTLHSANVQKAADYTGAPVLTDSRMKMFAWWFESRLAACPETKTYTLCPEGLNVPGITPATPKALLAKPDITKEKTAFLEAVLKLEPCVPAEKKSELEALLKAFPTETFLEQYPFLRPYV